MQRKCISAVLWQNSIKHPPIFTSDVSNNFYRTITHGGPSHRIFTSPPPPPLACSCSISQSFTVEPLTSVTSLFFITVLASLLTCCFVGDSPIPPCWNSPLPPCSFNRPWYTSFKGIRASKDLFIKNFFFCWSPGLSAFNLGAKSPPKRLMLFQQLFASLSPWLTSRVRCKFVFSPPRKRS